jgi:ribosomal-protein-alanine N-acetyltransferase
MDQAEQPVTLVPMQRADIDAVMGIERASFVDPWARVAFEREVTNSFSRPLVARNTAGEIVGYVIYWIAGPEVHVLNLAVTREYQRKGVGNRMMDRALSDATAAGAEVVVLEVRPSNAAARALYARLGFEEVSRRRKYYTNGEDALILVKNTMVS